MLEGHLWQWAQDHTLQRTTNYNWSVSRGTIDSDGPAPDTEFCLKYICGFRLFHFIGLWMNKTKTDSQLEAGPSPIVVPLETLPYSVFVLLCCLFYNLDKVSHYLLGFSEVVPHLPSLATIKCETRWRILGAKIDGGWGSRALKTLLGKRNGKATLWLSSVCLLSSSSLQLPALSIGMNVSLGNIKTLCGV